VLSYTTFASGFTVQRSTNPTTLTQESSPCPSGYIPTGGGYLLDDDFDVTQNFLDGNQWKIVIDVPPNPQPVSGFVQIICASLQSPP
jgi:hypothetical protein